MKKKLSRIFAYILCLMIGFIFVGCAGNDSDYADSLKEAYENGQISYEEYLEQRQSSMSVPLYGTKVLYRPTSYNWDDNVGGEENSNYYEQYAWWLLNGLLGTYGLADQSNDNNLYVKSQKTEKPIIISSDAEIKTGWYDSIRYQMQEYSDITLKKIELDNAGNETVKGQTQFFEITANHNSDWNWTLGLQTVYTYADNQFPLSPIEKTINNNSYLTQIQKIYTDNPLYNSEITIGGSAYPTSYYYDNDNNIYFYKDQNKLKNILNNIDINGDYIQTGNLPNLINYYWSLTNNTDAYSRTFLGTEYTKQNNGVYSDYVKALEYAIYCINLDLRPNNITVNIDSTTGMPIVKVDGYPATADKSSAEVALENIKEIFKQIGTYVGVTERQQIRLKNWILENIIGTDSDSTFEIAQTEKTYTQYVANISTIDTNGDGKIDENDPIVNDPLGKPQTKEVMVRKIGNQVVYYKDSNGNVIDGQFDPDIETTKTNKPIEIDRKYEENVEAIIDICTKQVSIGNSSGDENGPNIDDKFVASEICDYYGNDFFISADSGNEFKNIPVMEYQSMCFMFGKDYEFSNMMLFFRYGYDKYGNQAVPDDASLTINVYLHKYTKATNTWKVIPNPEGDADNPQFTIEVKAGPFDYGSKNNTMMMFGLKERDEQGNQTGVKCGEWNRQIADGALNSITDGYIGWQSIGTRLPINGNDKRKDYYQLVDRAVETDPITGDTTKYVSYGILNPAAFALDENGCDYIEIAFKIVKDTYDQNSGAQPKNYSFQVGIGMIDGPASTRK